MGIGFNGSGGTIFIKGGTITAAGGSGSAGISSGSKLGGTADSLTINEGFIEAKGGGYGAGIGGGSFQTAGIITINGGIVTSIGGNNGAGIGGGYQGSGGVVNLNGGKITATGGYSSAGIGGGYFGEGADVTVTGVPVVIAIGDTEKYAGNIGCGSSGMNCGTLKDNLNNDLIYILFNITNLPEVNIKVEVLQDDNWTKITDDSCQTDEHGLYSFFTYDNYYSGRYTLSKPGYEALIGWYYPYLKNINIITEMNVDNTPPAVTDFYIQDGELCIFLDDYGVCGTLYFLEKEDTTYYSKSDLDNISEAMTIKLNWSNDVYIKMSELNEGYYQIYVADSAENLSVPYDVYYSKPKSTTSKYMGSLSSGSEKFSIQTKLNKLTKNAETNISTIPFEDMPENITVSIPDVKGALSYSLSFTKGALSSAKENMYVEVNTKLGTIVFPTIMIDKIQADKEDKISLNIQSGDISYLPIELKELLKNKSIIQLTLTVNGIQKSWNNPEAPVTVSIPYTPAPEDHDIEHIVVWYIDGDGNVVTVPNGRYDKDTGKVTFTTTHFSQYAVAYVEKTFKDIESTEWAKHSIEVLTSKGILQGVTDTEYAPEKSITRADFLYYLVKTLSIEAAAEENFEDISDTSYYYKEISIAKKLGITNGTGNNKFDPDSHITRQDMMVLTENALKLIKNLQNYTATSEIEKYNDSFHVSEYAKNSISYLLNEGLIVGNDNKINPLGNTTRAEAAVFLYRIYNKY
ncbi:S-layer homology domain-containing protein [Sedimentibacter sp. B4]|uniref:S-layer homology domain-containing protein n=1 Tax=Sedimentibacter sp. B4 TaxID=304766 RepID=UPI000302B039|nr:S-layer homology domain-containing protein [Sedimentibacter sp. B4]